MQRKIGIFDNFRPKIILFDRLVIFQSVGGMGQRAPNDRLYRLVKAITGWYVLDGLPLTRAWTIRRHRPLKGTLFFSFFSASNFSYESSVNSSEFFSLQVQVLILTSVEKGKKKGYSNTKKRALKNAYFLVV